MGAVELAALLGRRHRGDRPGVPLVEPGERRVEVQPAERRRQRPAPAVLAPRPGGDREERERASGRATPTSSAASSG